MRWSRTTRLYCHIKTRYISVNSPVGTSYHSADEDLELVLELHQRRLTTPKVLILMLMLGTVSVDEYTSKTK